jgi:hypothetical protein
MLNSYHQNSKWKLNNKNNIETQVTNLPSGDGWNPTQYNMVILVFPSPCDRLLMDQHFRQAMPWGHPWATEWGTETSFSMLMGKLENPPTSRKTKSLFSKPFSNAGFLKKYG